MLTSFLCLFMSSKRPSRTVRRLFRVVVLLVVFCLLSSSPSLRKLLIVKNNLRANSLSEWWAKRSARECTSERRSREGRGRRRELSFFPALGSTCAYRFVASPILSRPLICFYSLFRLVLSIFLIVLEQAAVAADNTVLDLNNSSYLCFLRRKGIQ